MRLWKCVSLRMCTENMWETLSSYSVRFNTFKFLYYWELRIVFYTITHGTAGWKSTSTPAVNCLWLFFAWAIPSIAGNGTRPDFKKAFTCSLTLFPPRRLLVVVVPLIIAMIFPKKNLKKRLGRNMVYPGPIDPYFLAVTLIPEPWWKHDMLKWADEKNINYSF